MRFNIVSLSLLTIAFTLCLTACWDQRLLKDHTLILSIGFDSEDKNILKTISFPNPSSQSSVGSASSPEQKGSKTVSTIGNTIKDAEKKLDKVIPEQFDRSKTRLILLGEPLAKDGIFSSLDSLYRDLRGPLNAHIAIFAGQAKDALSSAKVDESMLVSDAYADLLNSAEQSGIIVNHSVQDARPFILGEGRDVILPLLSLDENKEPYISGSALFHGDKMTGTINMKETIVFLMLSDQVTKNLAINLQISDDQKDPRKNFINISVRSNKQKMKVETRNGEIKAKIDIKLHVEIDEYASDNLDDKIKNDKIGNQIEKELDKLAENMIQKIQQVNNDSLQIGEKADAFHHETWEQIDWEEAYKNIDIETTFDVNIIHNGIIY